MSLERGAIVAGRYRILERAVQDSSAEVYRAEETDGSRRPVALEILHGDLPVEEAARHCARLQALEEPALARILGYGSLDSGGATFLASEWASGADFLEAARLLSSPELCAVLQQICRGLDTLHRNGIVHGDLRPGNLCVVRRKGAGDDALLVRILGFGRGPLRRTESDQGGDALIYAAPEMLRSGPVDGRADLYALGVLLYQALTGSLPFDASSAASVLRGHLEETPRAIDPARTGVPAEIAALVTRLLMKDAADRYASAEEVANAFSSTVVPSSKASAALSARDLGTPTLVGRERDIEALAAFLDSHRRGDGGDGMALLLGEGGIGKSRLLAEMAQMAATRDLLVHRGFCHETGGAPFGAFLEVLQWAARTAEEEGLRPSDEEERGSADLIARYGAEVVKVAPGAFAYRAVVPSEQLLPRHERLRLIDVIGTFLLEVSLFKPFLLAIEDLHWADDASADLVDYLLRNRGRGRLALAASARLSENRAQWLREGLEREAGPGVVLRLPLSRLSEMQVATLLRESLGLAEPPPELAARVQKDAGGNPFFVVEMLRDLAEEGVLAWRHGGWACDMPALRKRVPSSSITQALERRVARASVQEVQVLRALAILDRNIDAEILTRVAASATSAGVTPTISPDKVLAVLESLIDRGLVSRCEGPPPILYAIAHDAARDLLVRGTAEETRHLLHRAAGLVLEDRHGTESDDGIERIAYHFVQAGDDERSARYCMRAAHKARRLSASEDSTYFYLQALKYHTTGDDPVRWEALRCLGEVYIVQSRPTHARPRFEELRRLAEAAEDPQAMAASYLGLADCARRLSDYATHMRFARAAFRIGLRADLLTIKTTALQSLGIGHFNLGNIPKATRCYSTALAMIPESGNEALRGLTLNRLGLAFLSRGDSRRARELFSQALQLAETHKLAMLASINNNLGCAAEKEARYDEALASYTRTEQIGGQRGERYNQVLAWLNLAGVYLKLNNLAEAERLTRLTIKLAIEIGDRLLQGYATVYRAQICRLRGQTDDASEYVDDAWRNATQTGHREIRLIADLERAWISLDKGDCDTGATLARSVRLEATANKITETAAYAAVCGAEANRRRASGSNASEDLAAAWALLSESWFPEVEWRAHLVNGKLLEEAGSCDEADRHYCAGAAIVESLAAAISSSENREHYLREPIRMEMRVKGARALTRQAKHAASSSNASRSCRSRPASDELAALCGFLVGGRTIEDVCRAVLSTAIHASRADGGVVLRNGRCGNRNAGTRELVRDGVALNDDDHRSALVAKACLGEAVSDLTGGESVARRAGTRAFGSRLRVAVPIPDAAGVWGVLYVETTKESLVGSYSLGILQAMAAQAGLAIAKLSMEPSVRSTVAPGEAARSPERFGELSSVGAPMLAAFAQLRGIAAAMAPVLLQGESGTGKELAARAIHSLSSRSSQPFVAIDCGAIPETLAEAELFGCVRGAFSGATEPRPGLIATSHRGTLFLDEVGNMPFALQAKLLRVLQTGEVRAVGAVGCRTVDFRLVSATNSDLEAEVRAGRFRPDLYYRLAGLVVRLPPLRERRADIVHLATQILEEARGEHERSSTTLSRDAVSHLVGHDWPGNVRELHHAVAAARALAGDGPILGDHIARAIQPTPLEGSEGVAPRRDEDQLALIAALAATNGDKTAAARRLGWSRMRVYRVLRRSSNTFDVRTQ